MRHENQSDEMQSDAQKDFVLDTNVILHDSACLYHFEEHNIHIPISVLEELDQFKKGSETLNYHAREFLRALDALSGDQLFNGGIEIGDRGGKVSVQLEREFHPDLEINFSRHKNDHRVLNAAYCLAREKTNPRVILVTKDVNLRMKLNPWCESPGLHQ